MADRRDTIVQATFGDKWIEITLIEPDAVTDRVQEIRIVQVDPTLVAEQLDEVFSALEEIVEKGLIYKRNPPATFTRER